jgi:uncharacterized protein (DUF488 family)
VAARVPIWTIGHSNHSLDAFKELLARERIDFVVDVRSFPFSRFAPQFNQEDLEQALLGEGIRYLFLGGELGGRPSREDHYDAEGHALYGPMSSDPSFQEAIDRLVFGAASHRIALLCSEGQPQHCHRRLLVGRVLTQRGILLRHILPDATMMEEETVTLDAGTGQPTLFSGGSPAWRSTQSVSHRRRLSTSSAA